MQKIIDDFKRRTWDDETIILEFEHRFDAMLTFHKIIKENNDKNRILQDACFNELEILETINAVVIFQANAR